MLNSEGANGPVDQRDDNKEAKKTCARLYREYAVTSGYVTTRSHPQDQVRRQRPAQQFEGHEDDFYRIDSEQNGHIILLQPPRVLLHHLGDNHPTAGGQHAIGTLHGLSNRFFWSPDVTIFALQEIAIPV